MAPLPNGGVALNHGISGSQVTAFLPSEVLRALDNARPDPVCARIPRLRPGGGQRDLLVRDRYRRDRPNADTR